VCGATTRSAMAYRRVWLYIYIYTIKSPVGLEGLDIKAQHPQDELLAVHDPLLHQPVLLKHPQTEATHGMSPVCLYLSYLFCGHNA
jgi:hypothetical protein